MSLRDDLIARLRDEIRFLEESSMSEEDFENYRYGLCGDLSEFRRF